MSHEMRKIGVTGATGNIGHEVMRQGKAMEHVLFVPIIRNADTVARMRSEGKDARWLDLEHSLRTDYPAAITGLDAIIHLAASVSERNDFELHDIYNTEATKKLAQAAAKQGAVLVFAGSIAQYSGTTPGTIIDETLPYSRGAYGLSKNKAYEAARKLKTPEAKRRGYDAIQVIPGMVIGPDASWTHTWKKVMENPVGRFLSGILLDNEVAWTDKEDLARLFIQIATNPYATDADRILAINGMASTNALFETFSELAGVTPPQQRIPKRGIEQAVKLGLTVMRSHAPVSPEVASFVLHGKDHPFDPSLAERDYGWKPKSLETTLLEIKRDFRPRTT